MIDFKLPSLGADMDEGTLLQWHVKPGDTVKRGQVVAVVDTSKAAVDVEIWHDGVIAELLVQPGQQVPVGAVLATLRAPGEAVAPAGAQARPAVSPLARRRAAELGVDPGQVRGTGAQGSVTVADIEAAVPGGVAVPASVAPAAAPAGATLDRQQAMRRAIAAAMSRSKREIPHYYLSETIPMALALAWLQRHNEGLSVTERVLPAVLLLKAMALALARTPELNGFYRNGQFEPVAAAHVGVAISLRGGGLVAPAIHDVASKPLAQLMRDLSDLVKRVRAGSLRSSEMADPTITLTNLGDQGVQSVSGVIYPPQVALLGLGRIAPGPWVQDGVVLAQPLVCATLAADHRVSDGHRGALFLASLRELLQQPQQLADTHDPIEPVIDRQPGETP